MRKLSALCFFICALLNNSQTVAEDNAVFNKCCPLKESLVKVVFSKTTILTYECVNELSAQQKYNVTNFSLMQFADNTTLQYSIPKNCELRVSQVTDDDLESYVDNVCYDNIIAEIIDGFLTQNVVKIVSLTCVQNDTEPETTIQKELKVELFRKCCPPGQAYDTEYHVCNDIDEENKNDWLFSLQTKANGFVFDVESGLSCKSEEYSVEINDRQFIFEIEDGILKVSDDVEVKEVKQGDWCVDIDYNNNKGVIARVCTSNCSQYGAFCFRKCCPVGEHYSPVRCGTARSKCVPSHDVRFNASVYFDPIEAVDENLLDIQGIRTGLKCSAGKFALNRSSPNDRHFIGTDGLLRGTFWDPHNYCIEMFDYRFCPDGDVTIMPLACFIPEDIGIHAKKNFLISAVAKMMADSILRTYRTWLPFTFMFWANAISAVALILTLLVYLSLHELRNLHGRTVICHSLTMLVGYSCLARVQFGNVEDTTLCTVLGYGIYFGFVGAFVWLNVMCFDIWWTFGNMRSIQHIRKGNSERRRFIWYSFYAWGVTLLFTIVVYLFDTYPVSDHLKANMGRGICWFGTVQNASTDWPHYIFFVIPMGVLTSINLVLWILTARHCARVKSEVHRMQAGSVGDRAKKHFRVDRAKYVLTGKLWIVMGAGWISELLSTLFVDPIWLWAFVDLINSLQGLFIFLILVCKPKVYRLIRKRLGLEKADAQKNGTSPSGRTSSTFLSRTISSDERTTLRASLPNNISNDLKKA